VNLDQQNQSTSNDDSRMSVNAPDSESVRPQGVIRTSSRRISNVLRWQQRQRRRDRKRFYFALSVSFALHVAILIIKFYDTGLGLPGSGSPMPERRIQVPDLSVVLVPPEPRPASSPESSKEEAAAQPLRPLILSQADASIDNAQSPVATVELRAEAPATRWRLHCHRARRRSGLPGPCGSSSGASKEQCFAFRAIQGRPKAPCERAPGP